MKREQMYQIMRPEFINRIDEIITFGQLDENQIAEIVRLQMKRVSNMLELQGFRLSITDDAIKVLAKAGFDPDFGARPVKRAIQHDVLNALSKELLAGRVSRENEIIVDADNDNIVFHS